MLSSIFRKLKCIFVAACFSLRYILERKQDVFKAGYITIKKDIHFSKCLNYKWQDSTNGKAADSGFIDQNITGSKPDDAKLHNVTIDKLFEILMKRTYDRLSILSLCNGRTTEYQCTRLLVTGMNEQQKHASK